ncbi:hypothetical protein [Mycolicibacterium arenosum]|uniref:PASTA domain-containing protein n=1 Tax=Mycolicibacterium arenosum TaxID=2952157 RepID=A0ABT1LUS3_9MYCO|nr:hypothetical protein [Mycolicibacterium sp. CAU 1645]MCP9270654.1 hypothetical protein [Mycolicibacterium sp. CAU 1645]
MRTTFAMAAAAVGICGAALAPAAFAGADEESATETIARLQQQGYTVTIDKIGTAPISDCTVTSVRNPQTTSQLVPYVGPGLGGDRILVPQVTSQTVSVSLNCS